MSNILSTDDADRGRAELATSLHPNVSVSDALPNLSGDAGKMFSAADFSTPAEFLASLQRSDLTTAPCREAAAVVGRILFRGSKHEAAVWSEVAVLLAGNTPSARGLVADILQTSASRKNGYKLPECAKLSLAAFRSDLNAFPVLQRMESYVAGSLTIDQSARIEVFKIVGELRRDSYIHSDQWLRLREKLQANSEDVFALVRNSYLRALSGDVFGRLDNGESASIEELRLVSGHCREVKRIPDWDRDRLIVTGWTAVREKRAASVSDFEASVALLDNLEDLSIRAVEGCLRRETIASTQPAQLQFVSGSNLDTLGKLARFCRVTRVTNGPAQDLILQRALEVIPERPSPRELHFITELMRFGAESPRLSPTVGEFTRNIFPLVLGNGSASQLIGLAVSAATLAQREILGHPEAATMLEQSIYSGLSRLQPQDPPRVISDHLMRNFDSACLLYDITLPTDVAAFRQANLEIHSHTTPRRDRARSNLLAALEAHEEDLGINKIWSGLKDSFHDDPLFECGSNLILCNLVENWRVDKDGGPERTLQSGTYYLDRAYCQRRGFDHLPLDRALIGTYPLIDVYHQLEAQLSALFRAA